LSAVGAQRSSDAETAAFRWKVGHHTFHLYLVAMISVLHELNDERGIGDARVTDLLVDLAALFDATAASMRYASDFAPDTYDRDIRPSMAPPAVKPGFSGLLNVDHQRMMVELTQVPAMLQRRYGADMGRWPSSVAAAWDALVDSEQEARCNHGRVCRRLVVRGPSLLRMQMAGIDP
jgi:hypothetical protein